MATLEFTRVSFNPSFTGIALVALITISVVPSKLRFQSFFYWNCLGGLILVVRNRPLSMSFNPSFTGIALVAKALIMSSRPT